MFQYNMHRSVLLLQTLLRSNRSLSRLALASNIISSNPEKIPKQFLNSRYIVNYKRNFGEQSKNTDKVSRTIICCKYLRLIKNTIRESGPDFATNPKLLHLIQNAQKNNLSPEFIDFVIKMSCNTRARLGLFDVLLSNGCHFLIQYEDIDTAITKHHLLQLCERYDGSLIQGETFWPNNFQQKGIISIKYSNSDPFASVSKEMLISKIGVESHHKETDVEGVEYWKLYCDPWLLPDVKKRLSEITNNIEEACIGYVPKQIIIPSVHIRSSIYNIFFKLCEVPTIDNVYSNINLAQ